MGPRTSIRPRVGRLRSRSQAGRSHRATRRSRGQSIVELAIILPVVLLLLAAAIDLGRLFYSQITIANAAREGALAAAQDPTRFQPGFECDATHGPSTNRITCAIQKETRSSALSVPASRISMSCDGTPITTPGDVSANCVASMDHTISITVTGQFSLVTPLLSMFTGGQTIDLASTATSIPRELPPSPPPPASVPPSPSPSPSESASASPSESPSGAPSENPSPSSSASVEPSASPSGGQCLAPIADFDWSPASPSKKTNVTFTDRSIHMDVQSCALRWTWSFGDGSGGSILQNPVYSYQARGTYTVTLLVTNSVGSDQRVQSVTVPN